MENKQSEKSGGISSAYPRHIGTRIIWVAAFIITIIALIPIGNLARDTIKSAVTPAPEAWYQRELIGQGVLTGVELAGAKYLVSLQVMRSESTSDNVIYSTFVFALPSGQLTVRGAAGGDYNYRDVPVFELGEWYFLYRKLGSWGSAGNRYLLIVQESGDYPLLVSKGGS